MPMRGEKNVCRDFVDAIFREFDSRKDGFFKDNVETLYIGGGTPSVLPESELSRLLSKFTLPSISEITVEVNPEDVDDSLINVLIDHGVNRVSMGIQSFNSELLKFVGRRHSADDITRAVLSLRRAGITNISCDLIFGLPGDTLDGWQYSVNRFLELGLPHLSAYLLSYEPGTRLTAMRNSGKIKETPDKLVVAMYEYLIERVAQHGYDHYEISNYAIPGFHSRHNSSYWNGSVYLGLGPGAHSFNGDTRSFNPSSLKQYLQQKGVDVAISESLSENDQINDLIITSMRTANGLSLSKLPAEDINRIKRDAVSHFRNGRLCISTDNRLYIPEKYFLVSDSIIVDLIR